MDKFTRPVTKLITSFQVLWKLWTTGHVSSAEWVELGEQAGVIKKQ